KIKSTDPDTRVAGVQELGDTAEDAAVLAAVAREDVDVRVRRVAAARIADAAVLADLARTDADQGLRGELIDRLASIASSSDSIVAAQHALAGLSDPKQIAIVAKESPIDSVRLDAVGRLTDVKMFFLVATPTTDPRVASAA